METREDETGWQNISHTGVKSIYQPVGVLGPSADSSRYAEQLGAPPDCIPDVYAFPKQLQLSSLEQMSKQDLIAAQAQDPLIGPTMQAIKCDKWQDNSELLPFKREMGKLIMTDGFLHRVSTCHTGKRTQQLVLPAKFKAVVLKAMHDELGHLGMEWVTDIIRS